MASPINGHEFEHTPGDGEGQGSLACCSPYRVTKSRTRVSNRTTSPCYRKGPRQQCTVGQDQDQPALLAQWEAMWGTPASDSPPPQALRRPSPLTSSTEMQSTGPPSLPVFQTKGAGGLGLGAGAWGPPTDPAYQLCLPSGSPISHPLQAQPPLGALGLIFLSKSSLRPQPGSGLTMRQ